MHKTVRFDFEPAICTKAKRHAQTGTTRMIAGAQMGKKMRSTVPGIAEPADGSVGLKHAFKINRGITVRIGAARSAITPLYRGMLCRTKGEWGGGEEIPIYPQGESVPPSAQEGRWLSGLQRSLFQKLFIGTLNIHEEKYKRDQCAQDGRQPQVHEGQHIQGRGRLDGSTVDVSAGSKQPAG